MDSLHQIMLVLPLIMLRLGPVLLVSGIEPFARIPLLVRTFIALAMAIAVVPNANMPALSITPASFVSVAMRELLLGMILVFGLQAAFAAISTLSHLLDNQFGLTAAGILNPATETSDGPIAMLFAWLGAVFFFESGVHIEMIAVVAQSYRQVPIGAEFLQIDMDALMSIVGFQFLLADDHVENRRIAILVIK